jgi:hypothetical protein
MTYTISPDRRQLTIHATSQDQEVLRGLGETIHQDDTMHAALESLVCNSELDWINPADTGDLTDAPMLGILGEPGTIDEMKRLAESKPGICGSTLAGHWRGKDRHLPILDRWGWMNYAVKSLLEALRDDGEAMLVNGE